MSGFRHGTRWFRVSMCPFAVSIRSFRAGTGRFTATIHLDQADAIKVPGTLERGCVVLVQPQRVDEWMLRRLVFDTTALRPLVRGGNGDVSSV